jgi:hypothetical protein
MPFAARSSQSRALGAGYGTHLVVDESVVFTRGRVRRLGRLCSELIANITPSLNSVRSESEPARADDEIQRAQKKVEQDLSDWLSAGLVDEREAVDVRSAVGELLDGYAVGEATREEASDAYDKISRDVLNLRPSQEAPPIVPETKPRLI